MILHACGTFGWYNSYPLGIEYDHYVHALFDFSLCLLINNYFTKVKLSPIQRICLVMLIVMGICATHEVFEYCGAVFFGEGEVSIYIGAGDLDEWDTQKDLLNALIEAITAQIIIFSVKIKIPTL